MYLAWSRYFVLVFMCGVLLATGCAIAYVHMGGQAASTSFQVGAIVCGVYLALALPVWLLQKQSCRYGLVAACMMVVAAASMTLAASLPVFFAIPFDSTPGGLLALTLLAACGWQAVISMRYFDKRWAQQGPTAVQRSISGHQLDLHRLARELQLAEAPFYLLGKSSAVNIALSALILGSLVLGLNLRKIDPTAALFLWSVPGLLLAAWIAQPLVMTVKQWQVVSTQEAMSGSRLLALSEFW